MKGNALCLLSDSETVLDGHMPVVCGAVFASLSDIVSSPCTCSYSSRHFPRAAADPMEIDFSLQWRDEYFSKEWHDVNSQRKFSTFRNETRDVVIHNNSYLEPYSRRFH